MQGYLQLLGGPGLSCTSPLSTMAHDIIDLLRGAVQNTRERCEGLLTMATRSTDDSVNFTGANRTVPCALQWRLSSKDHHEVIAAR